MKLGVVLVAATVLVGCPKPRPAPPHTGSGDCAAAEATFARLGCVDARGQSYAVTKGGRRFADVCAAAADAGVDVHPACIAKASSCSEALACSL